MSTVLQQIKYPFKLFETQDLDNYLSNDGPETITTDKNNHIKLVLQYYPNDKNYDTVKFSELKKYIFNMPLFGL